MNRIDLPNRFDHASVCPRIYALWEQGGHFQADPDPTRKAYCIVIPPPNVTGALHLGHALNNTLQDVQIRYHRMLGYNTLWVPGTDHAGIATQAVVERRLLEEEGLTRHQLGREGLVARIWQWKDQYESRILSQLKQMGCSCDWRRTRFTLDPICARAVRHTFFDLFRKKLIFRGKRLVNWDTYLQTAVSDDEVFTESVAGHLWHLRYPVIDPLPGEPPFVVVATTRPETMLGDTAVAVHPEPRRALDEALDELERKLAAAGPKEQKELEQQRHELLRRKEELIPVLEKLRDMARAGRLVRLPLVDRPIPLVLDSWAKPDMGSGCVKITPAHDPNDYEVALRHNLPMINILNPDGTLNQQAGAFSGLTIEQGRRAVVAALEDQGLLEKVEPYTVDLPFSDRSKTPIEPLLTDQWFVKMESLAQMAMDAVTDGRIRIVPARYAKMYLDWLAEKRDWPVSRQLWWGHQIPVWSRTITGSSDYDRWIRHIESLEPYRQGTLAYQWEPSEAGESQGRLHVSVRDDDPQLEAQLEAWGFARDPDVLDTWFSSALWPHSTLGWPDPTEELRYFYPTSTLITSRDIITLWVARMVMMGLNNTGQIPFREVYVHPKILDGEGETMSKSKGNGIDPLDIIVKFGPDALRFGMAYLTTETQDVRMPVEFECPHCEGLMKQTRQNRMLPRLECPKCGKPFATQWASRPEDQALPRAAVVSERFEQARNFCNKLWNAARFTLRNLDGFQPAPIEPSELLLEDRWMLSRLAAVTQAVTSALDAYQYSDAARELYNFAWDEFCSFYIEIMKDRLADARQRPAAQRMLALALDTLLRLLHPLIPFITEEIWQLLNQLAPRRGWQAEPAEKVLISAAWPQADRTHIDSDMEARFRVFQSVLGAVREIRSRHNIAPRSSLPFYVRCSPEDAHTLQSMQGYFGRMANAELVQAGSDVDAPLPHAAAHLGWADVFVDLAGFIDVEAERNRLEKQQSDLRRQIEAKEKKLANRQFRERAPVEVVAKEEQSLEQLRQQLASIQSALAQLPSASKK
ncbi:MAG: valine--tRNA ligase [Pirellulaceae bacterium]|nr:MAG: valine--tRNA ligase [Pirellulaceae bacterium]